MGCSMGKAAGSNCGAVGSQTHPCWMPSLRLSLHQQSEVNGSSETEGAKERIKLDCAWI